MAQLHRRRMSGGVCDRFRYSYLQRVDIVDRRFLRAHGITAAYRYLLPVRLLVQIE